jgi:hypothetical protein
MAPILCSLLIIAVLSPSHAKSSSKEKLPAIKPQIVTIDDFESLLFQPETGVFNSPGPVRIILEDPDTGEKTTILADDAEGTPSGNIIVKGKIQLLRAGDTLTGNSLLYSETNRIGTVSNAETNAGNVKLKGKTIQLLPGEVMLAKDASFTTCSLGRPDYHITASEVRVYPNALIKAKNITFWLGGTKVFYLPSFEKSFAHTVQNPLPLPSYSQQNGLSINLHNDFFDNPNRSGLYNITLAMKHAPQGMLSFEQDIAHTPVGAGPPYNSELNATEPLRTALEINPAFFHRESQSGVTAKRNTLFALVTADTFVDNRTRTDLRVSRLPEIGFGFYNILNRTYPDPSDPDFHGKTRSAFGTGFFSPASWMINAQLSAGYYKEVPTDTESGRFSLRLDAASPLFSIASHLCVRYGATLWSNYYTNTEDSYAMFSPEAELDWLMKKNTFIAAAYRLQQDTGKTPFVFDHKDVPHEVRLQYGFLGAHWSYGLNIHYDVQRWRAYDTEMEITKRFDCMEIGLSYRTRYEGLNIILNLLPAKPKSQ